MKSWFFILASLFASGILAQSDKDDYVNDNYIRYQDWTYKNYIKTIQLHEASWELSAPIIELSSNQQLKLSFDDLEGGYKSYSYTLIHCEANWAPTDIMQAEYLTGFFEDNISNYTFSFNTLQKYTHYTVTFPNNTMKFNKSGNYVMKVYQDNDKENLVLTKRFMVFQNKVTVSGYVHQAAGSDDYYNKQEVDFSVFTSGYNMTNPFSDMKVVVCQNNRWDNAIYGMKPMFTKDKELTFDYDDGTNVFNGGNEFRNFDMKSIRYLSQFLKASYKDSNNVNHVDLLTDEIKTFKRYSQVPDINGGYLVKIQERDNSDIEADYCVVNFFFPYDNPINNGNFYILGKLCDWRMSKENRMTYNYKRMGYECNLLLKQGYYNYEYAFLEDGKTASDETVVEGNHWETENDYAIYVYHRQQGTYYDQLIGFKRMNSIRK
ncbi:MAG: DUF5103 domain-containing protein [Bacteroidia bacterium]